MSTAVVDLTRDSPPRRRAGEAGPSRAGPSIAGEAGRRAQVHRPAGGREVVDLLHTNDHDDDDDVVVVAVRPANRTPTQQRKRPRPSTGLSPGGPAQQHAAAAPNVAGPSARPLNSFMQMAAAAAAAAAAGPPRAPSPERAYKCPVCLERIENGRVASTICGHVFCEPCIVACIKATRKCPKCRKGLTVKQVHKIFLDTE